MPAPTFTNLTAGGASSATSFTTASVSPSGNQLILVTVHGYISTGSAQPAQPTVTGNGITYALVRAQNVDTAGVDRATMWVFRGMAASPTSGAVTISFGATTMTRCEWSVDLSDANVNTQGTNGSKAISQITGVTLGSTATSASVNFASTMETKNSAFSAWGHQTNEAKTPKSGWTELADNFAVTFCSIETQFKAGTDTAGSASWATASLAGGILLEIVAPPVLLAAYNYGEASGSVLDLSGNSLNFALTGTSARTSAGGGYTYGGTRPNSQGLTQSSAGVQSGPATTTLNTLRRTMMTWAKAGGADPSWFLEWHDTAGNTGVFGWLLLSGAFTGRMKETPSNTAHDITLTADGTNFHHWAMTYDGATFAAYKDGALVSSTASTAFAASDILYMLDQSGSGLTLSDTRVYDDALDAATISTLKDTPLDGSGISGSAAVTQAAQTSSATGQLGYSGSSTATQAANTSSATGTVVNPVTGTSAASQANQTAAAAGQLGYSGTSAAPQAANTSSATGQLGYSGTSARTQANQTSTATGQLGYSATGSPAQANQTSTASGTFTAGGSFTGSAAVTQANQTPTATGQLGYSASGTPAQANNTSASAGTVVNPTSGTGSPAQANQTSTAVGQFGSSGSATTTQAANTSTATGTFSPSVTGSAAAAQAKQTAIASGTFAPLVTFGTASGGVGMAASAQPATGAAPRADGAVATVPTSTGA